MHLFEKNKKIAQEIPKYFNEKILEFVHCMNWKIINACIHPAQWQAELQTKEKKLHVYTSS